MFPVPSSRPHACCRRACTFRPGARAPFLRRSGLGGLATSPISQPWRWSPTHRATHRHSARLKARPRYVSALSDADGLAEAGPRSCHAWSPHLPRAYCTYVCRALRRGIHRVAAPNLPPRASRSAPSLPESLWEPQAACCPERHRSAGRDASVRRGCFGRFGGGLRAYSRRASRRTPRAIRPKVASSDSGLSSVCPGSQRGEAHGTAVT